MQIRPKTNSTEVTGSANQTTNRNSTNKREPGVPLGTRSPGAAAVAGAGAAAQPGGGLGLLAI